MFNENRTSLSGGKSDITGELVKDGENSRHITYFDSPETLCVLDDAYELMIDTKLGMGIVTNSDTNPTPVFADAKTVQEALEGYKQRRADFTAKGGHRHII